jgi:hypothetical protein
LTWVGKSLGKLAIPQIQMYPEITKKRNCFPAVTLRSGQARETHLVEVGKVERVAIVAV